ncbi:MAG: hypothetical protein BKP49_07850 [Treponema sp. CETP13]|nr:MAG: hypothetical protein BKP49_07850 [Treponema sp. CETP13]
MKFNINKVKLNLDIIILFFMYFQLVILNFWGITSSVYKLVVVLILIRFLFSFKILKKDFVLISLLLFTFILNVLFSDLQSLEVLKTNFLTQFYAVFYCYYIYYLNKYKREWVLNIFSSSFFIFNATAIINVCILLIQIFYPYSIIGFRTGIINDYYPDLISGLFGYSAVPLVCLFFVFVIIYDIRKYRASRGGGAKKFLFIFILLLSLVSVYISINNDNKAFFSILPFCIIMYLISNYKMRKLKFILYFFLSIICIIVLYYYNIFFNEFVNNYIIKLYRMIINSITISNKANGSNERIALILETLKTKTTWLFGKGFATISIYEENYLGYKHFGQSDFATLLLIGGIWYFVFLGIFYYRMFCSFVSNKINILFIDKIIVVLLMILIAIYTQCFTRANYMFCFILLLFDFSKVQQRTETDQIDIN